MMYCKCIHELQTRNPCSEKTIENFLCRYGQDPQFPAYSNWQPADEVCVAKSLSLPKESSTSILRLVPSGSTHLGDQTSPTLQKSRLKILVLQKTKSRAITLQSSCLLTSSNTWENIMAQMTKNRSSPRYSASQTAIWTRSTLGTVTRTR